MTPTSFAMPSGACHGVVAGRSMRFWKAPQRGPACDQELGGLRQPASQRIGDAAPSATLSPRNAARTWRLHSEKRHELDPVSRRTVFADDDRSSFLLLSSAPAGRSVCIGWSEFTAYYDRSGFEPLFKTTGSCFAFIYLLLHLEFLRMNYSRLSSISLFIMLPPRIVNGTKAPLLRSRLLRHLVVGAGKGLLMSRLLIVDRCGAAGSAFAAGDPRVQSRRPGEDISPPCE